MYTIFFPLGVQLAFRIKSCTQSGKKNDKLMNDSDSYDCLYMHTILAFLSEPNRAYSSVTIQSEQFKCKMENYHTACVQGKICITHEWDLHSHRFHNGQASYDFVNFIYHLNFLWLQLSLIGIPQGIL